MSATKDQTQAATMDKLLTRLSLPPGTAVEVLSGDPELKQYAGYAVTYDAECPRGQLVVRQVER